MNLKHISIMLFLKFLILSFSHYIFAQKVYVSKDNYNLFEPIELIIESSKLIDIQVSDLPKFEGLDFIGSSQNYKKNHQNNLYLYYFLFKAQKTGAILIPAFSLKLKHTKIDFKGKQINIQSIDNQFIRSQNLSTETWKLQPNDVFLQIQFSKNHAFVGEQIQQKLFLYVKESLVNKVFFEPQAIQNLLQNIKNTQFWEENIDSLPFQNVAYEYKFGYKYHKYLLNHSFLFAFFPGSIHYESIPFKIKKKKFFNHELLENPLEEVTIYSNPLDLTISNVPYPNIITGVFEIQYKKIPNKIKLGDKIDYQFTIKGNGNLNTFKPKNPVLNKTCDFYEFNPVRNQFVYHNELYYSVEFNCQIVPNDTGLYKISSYVIPFFNTKTQKKEYLKIPELTFRVENIEEHIFENQNINNKKNETYSYTGWNIWGVCVLISISFVFLWLTYKEFIR